MRLFSPSEHTDTEWLATSGFFQSFEAEWKRLQFRFFKLECLQSYQEPDDPSYQALMRKEFDVATRLLQERIAEQRPLYEAAQTAGVDIVRVRLVDFPISDYLRYELEGYKVAQQLGEQIFIVPISSIRSEKVLATLSDFLLFDRGPVLVHDYDPSGLMLGGWIVRDPLICVRYGEIANSLIERGMPFSEFRPD